MKDPARRHRGALTPPLLAHEDPAVGSGGREHALVNALARSPRRPELLAAPGNPGMAERARLEPVAADDLDGLVGLARREAVDLVVVGPEAPLVAGLADRLRAAGVAVFGPSAAAARQEGSRRRQDVMRARLPTAAGASHARRGPGGVAATRRSIKFDGCGGQGVVVARRAHGARGVTTCRTLRFGPATSSSRSIRRREHSPLPLHCEVRTARSRQTQGISRRRRAQPAHGRLQPGPRRARPATLRPRPPPVGDELPPRHAVRRLLRRLMLTVDGRSHRILRPLRRPRDAGDLPGWRTTSPKLLRR